MNVSECFAEYGALSGSVGGLWRNTAYEVMPLRSLAAAIPAIPTGAHVDVTRSPTKPLGETIRVACSLATTRPDLRVVPHIAARVVEGRRELVDIGARLAASGIDTVFVIAGDHTEHSGAYASGLRLIEDMREHVPSIRTIGIPGYPGGHPFIAEDALREHLVKKAKYANYITTQICFDVQRTMAWVSETHELGITLPVYVGIPGVLARLKLIRIAMQIGVGASVRFLRKGGGAVSNLLGAANYVPLDLVNGVCSYVQHHPCDSVVGFHINTFNQVKETIQWMRQIDWSKQ